MNRLGERQMVFNLALCPPDELATLERQLERIVFDDLGVRTILQTVRVARLMQAGQIARELSIQAVKEGGFKP